MDKETIKQIAVEIVAQLPFGNRTGPFLVIYVIITAVAAGFAAWFGSFLKTKGQNFATKEDFAELQRQLRANTELVETIKSEVGQRDWARREWTSLLRLKLEALFDKMHKCEADLERRRLAVFNRSPLERERDYLSELDTISSLYLPELVIETAAFSRECRSGHIAVLRLDQALYNAGDDGAARKRAYDDFNETWGSGRTSSCPRGITRCRPHLLERHHGRDGFRVRADVVAASAELVGTKLLLKLLSADRRRCSLPIPVASS